MYSVIKIITAIAGSFIKEIGFNLECIDEIGLICDRCTTMFLIM